MSFYFILFFSKRNQRLNWFPMPLRVLVVLDICTVDDNLLHPVIHSEVPNLEVMDFFLLMIDMYLLDIIQRSYRILILTSLHLTQNKLSLVLSFLSRTLRKCRTSVKLRPHFITKTFHETSIH